MSRHRAGHGHALITGGAGFIGSHLAETLLEKGYSVTALDDLSTGRADNVAHLVADSGFRLVHGSVADAATVEPLVAESDVVFHLAAAVGVQLSVHDPGRVIETNVLGTHGVLKAAAQHGTRVLLASTSEIYGKSDRLPFGEEDDRVLGPTTKARWSYSDSKAIDEFLGLAHFRSNGLPVVIFRLFNTVGPRQTGRYGMVVPRFVAQALKGEPLTVYGDGQQTRCFLDVKDAVAAIIGLAECPLAAGQVFNVGSTEEISILELARTVLTVVTGGNELDGRLVFVRYEEAYGADYEDTRRRVPDIRKVKATIGWQPRIALEETIGRIVSSWAKAPADKT